MTSPAIQEAKRIVERIRTRQPGQSDYAVFLCAGCRKSVVFSEYDACLNCRDHWASKKERR